MIVQCFTIVGKKEKKETFNIFIQLFNFSSSCVSCNIIFSVLFGFYIPYFTHTHILEHINFGKFSHQEPKQKRSLILYLLIILSGIFLCVWFCCCCSFVSLRFLFYNVSTGTYGFWRMMVSIAFDFCVFWALHYKWGQGEWKRKEFNKKKNLFFVIFMGTKICYFFPIFFCVLCLVKILFFLINWSLSI